MRRFGRRLFNDELSPELVDQMRAYRVSKKTAEAICVERLLEEDDLQEVFERRKNDVLVYMASQQFDRARRCSKLSGLREI